MANKSVHKIKRAIVRGFTSGINLNTPNRFQPEHHRFGKEAMANDFNRVGTDIRNSMNSVKNNTKAPAS